ncbi:hypothetical protein EG68_05306 [Paragonimus skrjabini miyazakii]|uniref:Uncharacterized protein n=1 Tax=Paragonimus skrjabini miyazakii TaxID=59628 RepID=A0A8S9YQY1_9TREM|nr:hypothetical protein EG68_05306 [Paragonimus skrjabini miyazakii]
MADRGKRKRLDEILLYNHCRQAVVRSDFTYEVEEKRKSTVYPVDIDYSPPPPPLENMSHEAAFPKRRPLGSVENLPTFSSPIASSSTIISPSAAQHETACKNEIANELQPLLNPS